MKFCATTALCVLAILFAHTGASAAPIQITIHADQLVQPVNKLLSGICIEDVNHEIYGGLYSQMLFGESFQEPAGASHIEGFNAYSGVWNLQSDFISITGEDGPKLINDSAVVADGSIGVEIKFANKSGENAGLLVRVSKPANGADAFAGYEVSLDPARQVVRLGRHRQDYQLLQEASCEVPIDKWIPLRVTLDGDNLKVSVAEKDVLQYSDDQTSLKSGQLGLRAWRCQASFRHIWVQPQGEKKDSLVFGPAKANGEVSQMWVPAIRGTAIGNFSLSKDHPFIAGQSQYLSFDGGDGEVGVANQGLNHWGLNFIAGQDYEGCIWVKADSPAKVAVDLESGNGAKVYAEKILEVSAGDWRRIDLSLTPEGSDKAGRFALKLKQPASVTIGYAFLQPGVWGRFKGLPVRKDIVDGIIDQGVAVMRYGGSMVNSANYRWKNMIGPRDRRPAYRSTWYPYSSNGWGVFDFLDLCEAANILGIPDLNVNESPQDMADFIEYANGPADSKWGQKRAADGHPKPYRLGYLELGNEEAVDMTYFSKFAPIAEAIWAKDPKMILIVGDFSYHKIIADPNCFTGADGGIVSMDGQRRILELARRHDREVWFDIHIWSEQLQASDSLVAAPSYMNAIDRIANGAKHRVLTFELNANSHGLMRALANAMAINTLTRDNRMPIITSANGLQPDGQNDNGWDQGLLFLNPAKVWLQAPGYVMQMRSRNQEPLLVKCEMDADAATHLDCTAMRSIDRKSLVLQVIDPDKAQDVLLDLDHFVPTKPVAHLTELTGELTTENTAEHPTTIVPKESDWPLAIKNGTLRRRLPAHSFTIIRFE